MVDSSQELPDIIKKLPPLPQVLTRALELTRNNRSRRSDLAKVLSLDQGLTGYFLNMVNSAYYGLPRRITSLDEAIGYLGFETVEEVIFAMSASDTLMHPLPAYLLDRQMLWEHSVAVAEGCDYIARKQRLYPRSEVYVAGLLHDVGKLALDLMLSSQDMNKVVRKVDRNKNWMDIEREYTGRDHAELGAVVARSWNLPDRVVEAIAYHHTPDKATIDPMFTAAVHVANVASMMAGIGVGIDGLRYSLYESVIDLLEWSDVDMEKLVGEMIMAVDRAKQMIAIKRSQ